MNYLGLSFRHVCAAGLTILFLSAGGASADDTLASRVGSVFDNVARGLSEKANSILGRDSATEGSATVHVKSRTFEEVYPVSSTATVSITNEFGNVRVGVWDNPVVQITAEIAVQAQSAEIAERVCRDIDIVVKPSDKAVDATTVFPDSPCSEGKPSMAVSYTVTIPRTVGLICKNDFGDVYVGGANGSVILNVYYGAVELRDLGGAIDVRHRGGSEFSLLAEGLHQGGSFDLNGVEARFSEVSGDLVVSNAGGGTEFYDSGAPGHVEITNKSGAITYFLPAGPAPDVTATAVGGAIDSDVDLERVEQARRVIGRIPAGETKSHVRLNAILSDIAIRQQTASPPLASAGATPEAAPFKDTVLRKEAWVAADAPVRIEAVPGDITVTGGDCDEVMVTATKFARVKSKENIRAALDALQVKVENTEKGLLIRSVAEGDMAALGCTSYRLDLSVECPRTVNLDIVAANGNTSVSSTGGTLKVTQAAGTVAIEHNKGPVDATNDNGGVEIISCAGPVQAKTLNGDILVRDVYAAITVNNSRGKTVVESPHADVNVRNTNGDVRILALDGLEGNLEVVNEKGNIGVLIPQSTDASLSVIAQVGTVRSAIEMIGNVKKDAQEFAKVGTGPYRVTLQARNGDVYINE